MRFDQEGIREQRQQRAEVREGVQGIGGASGIRAGEPRLEQRTRRGEHEKGKCDVCGEHRQDPGAWLRRIQGLPGITRDLLVELLLESDIPCEEVAITVKELRQADEIWITSSTWEIVPVVQLDAEPVGTGKPGEIWKQATEIYQAFKTGMSNDA